MPSKKPKRKSKDAEEEDSEEEEEEDRERVTSKTAGQGLLILGFIMVLIAMIMPFVLGSSDLKMWSLQSETFLFGIAGLIAIGIGVLLINFQRLSRKL